MPVRVTSQRGYGGYSRYLKKIGARVLDACGAAEAELSLYVCGDRRMMELNSSWRGRAGTTDVLAFAQREGQGASLAGNLLGDVVICLDQARRQAEEQGVALEQELVLLLVHGVLHLLGYEHEGVDTATKRRMFRRQAALVKELWQGTAGGKRSGR